MASFANVTSVATTSTAVTPPNKSKDWLKVRNLDTTNGVWVQLSNGTLSASVEGNDCEYVGPGESIILPWLDTYYMIAVTSAVKVNVVAAVGRV